LYSALREACAEPGSSVTAIELAEQTGLHQRWLREWLAQQSGMGVLTLLEGTGDDDASLRYRIPRATAEVLADPSSKEYDIAMIQTVPALVHRAKTMLPLAFSSGIGRPYDEPEVAQAIDRSHIRHVRDVFLPQVLPIADDGRILELLQRGCTVADLGCGGGGLIISMAKAFPKSTFHGYEISKQALDTAAYNLGAAHLTVKNVFFHDANEPGESLGDHANTYDVITTFDVLHDCTQPAQLISQVKTALKPNVGVWLLADIPSAPTVRENLKMPGVGTYYSFSTCLCMACGLSEKGGLGLGTLGFSIPVAERMLTDGGFSHIEVLLEKDNARWFFVH
jgi:2-polyprenyl-3-methyl-5-hydroxy-6-metoxy-1,4-benzoquinol methylase